MNPNALTIDPQSHAITLPIGGTGSFIAKIAVSEGVELTPGSDVVLFAISDAKRIGAKMHTAAVFKKVLPILVNDNDEMYVRVGFINADTRELKPGDYVWDLTLITSPDYDSGGEVIVEDDSDNVIPIFAREGHLPVFTLQGVTVIV